MRNSNVLKIKVNYDILARVGECSYLLYIPTFSTIRKGLHSYVSYVPFLRTIKRLDARLRQSDQKNESVMKIVRLVKSTSNVKTLMPTFCLRLILIFHLSVLPFHPSHPSTIQRNETKRQHSHCRRRRRRGLCALDDNIV